MSGAPNKSRRILELDGLRGVAILSVVLYHYFQRFPDYTPYGGRLFQWTEYGYLGVHLFFIVSGFVIAFTLERTSGAATFFRNRFFRLWPAMVVSSSLTFSILSIVDTPFADFMHVGIRGFLPSWTFTAPFIWKPFIAVDNYIDGAYWSLFVEVRFYLWAIVVATFVGAKRLPAVLTGAVAVLAPVWHLSINPPLMFYLETLFFVPYLPLFAAGALAHQAFINRDRGLALAGFALTWGATLSFLEFRGEIIIVTIFFLAFLVLVVRRRWLHALSATPLVWIGSISYSLYLLHQNIGVSLLSALPVGWPTWFYILAVLAVFGVVVCLAQLVFVGVERPMQMFARRFDKRATAA